MTTVDQPGIHKIKEFRMQTKVVVRRFVFAAACAALLFGFSGCGGGGAGGGAAILPVAPTGAGAPPAAATSGSRVVSTALNSNATGATYPIQFYLPPGYDDSASTYPTIYITDGDAVYNLGVTRFKNFTDILEKAGKKVIVVGVGAQIATRNYKKLQLSVMAYPGGHTQMDLPSFEDIVARFIN